MAYEFYQNYIANIAQSPKSELRESNQESRNSVWEIATNIETILAQDTVGGMTYANEDVRVDSVFQPKTGKQFGNQYRRFLHYGYDDVDMWLGKMYQFNNYVWLTINTNTVEGSTKSSVVRQCNNFLKWIDENGILNVWDCVCDSDIKSPKFDEGSEGVPQVNCDMVVLVQQNEFTKLIPFNQRFIFDGHAFQTQQIDNHFSPTYMKLYLFETQIQPTDDLINNIANATDLPPINNEAKILPQMAFLKEGLTQLYSVYNYVNGVPTSDTFTILGSQVPTQYYKLTVVDGNHFTIENIKQMMIPLLITCTSNETPTIQTTTKIILGGKW